MSKKPKKPENEHSKHIVFVISPIGAPDSPVRKRSDQILKHLIEPVVSELDYEAVRADKISKPGIITSQIINYVIDASLVIADLTGHNPNVFYELAVRHAIKKPVIQIIKKGEKIPFDVSTTRTIQIDHKDLDSVDEAKKELRRQIKALEKDSTLVDSPISVAVDIKSLKQSGDPERKAIAELRAIMQENSLVLEEIRRKMAQYPEEHPARGDKYLPQLLQRRELGNLAVWMKIDESLPWIEMKGKYKTREEAKKAAREILDRVEIRIVQLPKKTSNEKKEEKT